jgi:hypothetical protein
MDAVTHPSPIAVWGVGLAFVAVTTVISACQPDDDSGTDGVVDDRCGEPGVCEGSSGTDHPGCGVPGVAVFDLDGRPICERQTP